MDNLPVIALRFALYADLMVLAGMAAFSFYALTRDEYAAGVLPLARPAIALSSAGFLLSALAMLALVASMTGSSLRVIDRASLSEIVGETAIGIAWMVRMAAMTVAVLSALALTRSPTTARVGLLVSAALAVATLIWTGHAGATEGWPGTAHRFSDIVHLLAAAVWIGGIAAFSWMLFRPVAARSKAHLAIAHRALDRFSRVGTLAVGLIVATGIINCLAVVGFPHFTQLPLTAYGKLLICKLLLFAAMLAIAALNRWRLTPALGFGIRNDSPTLAVVGLRRSLLAEGSAALAILALVAWLGTLDPLSTTR
ncbi:copper homeostasis membrane protein CopD [Novosphingobium sp. G106]|uniref:copper homeostasis membrane protein CopD n=1 Tax=Novosphingobium sp. G106 TaxID=2849500 RepID=UPI001C2D1D79|nr:copper homeostasis membrane protein CopD [Novosphingobium sp. G106]MBV1692387.1 copper homeostasis membrane protein CopD [Novosphingobium sp. G106]